MISNEDVEFIRQNFKYSLDRMTDLPNEIWGTYEDKQRRIKETEQRQNEIFKKLVI